MKKIKFSQLNFPTGLNLDLLANLLPETKFREFIVQYSRKKRKDRRIILPSRKTIKKVYFHYLWNLVETGEMSWEDIKKSFRKNFETLKEVGISKKIVKKFYDQRQKEIIIEKVKKQKGKRG